MEQIRLHAPAAVRNRDLILEVLRRHLPPGGLILEIASGSGEHCVCFGAGLPAHIIQPSDADPKCRASIDAWVQETSVENVRPALAIDATAASWPVEAATAILCINMIHIAPWEATLGLVAGAARHLAPAGLLYLYGPFIQAGLPTAPSNLAFDGDLRAQDPRWGIRNLDEIAAIAAAQGFSAPQVTPMPSNNLSVIFRRA
jgi:hypothetical protein